ncbi:MAG TPA: nucleotidyl transferase AbiEii/AbiGii toxin family protein [Solirubrobacteraceae bacterium]
MIALEQHIAEKIHAYTGTYGTAERESTRSKDLIDLVLISVLARPDAERLKQALNSTFHSRDRQPLPTSLPPPPSA